MKRHYSLILFFVALSTALLVTKCKNKQEDQQETLQEINQNKDDIDSLLEYADECERNSDSIQIVKDKHLKKI